METKVLKSIIMKLADKEEEELNQEAWLNVILGLWHQVKKGEKSTNILRNEIWNNLKKEENYIHHIKTCHTEIILINHNEMARFKFSLS